MNDPAGTAAAAVRAHMLLAEGHRPLTMTPGDLRPLLARYQRRLQELADAVEPVTAAQGTEADPKPGSDESQRSSDDPQPGSAHDMRRRLRDLPHGHPSSPYDEDGSRRPPVVRLRDVDLPEAEKDRSSAVNGGTQPIADTDERAETTS